MLKRIIIAVLALALLFGGVIGFKLFKQAKIREYLANRDTPPVYLNATLARAETWQQRLDAIGSLRARQGIEIRSEVSGLIRKLHVGSRESVAAGDVLVELDDTVDRATLKSARVRLEKARTDFQRDSALFERSLISEEQFDNTRSEFENAQALVEETQGIIDKKTIRAPFAGTVGIHNLNEGQYLDQGDELLTLQALDTLYLDINLPENELERLHPGQRVEFTVPTHGDQVFTGTLRYVDVRVQSSTRNVLLRAEVDNREHALLPGMFAKASIVLDEASDVVTLPREAVAFSLYGETAYLLEAAGKGADGQARWVARRRPVQSGELRDGRLALTGIDAGAWVALDTQNRLLEGSPVVIANLDAIGTPAADDATEAEAAPQAAPDDNGTGQPLASDDTPATSDAAPEQP
ncbi:efflux RND transporter periplasmic adaptor subunit [Mangrovimicrobium sediminis]|uniref:Efflux RND transporter periplasmic adaptor subunit n=1 Tax=Mangrovimicrobium sediminis TaxID=2562682 RepID=A0A4Z0M5I3_9GAMM|nr:efflux RND transporter periplasmic adaptor subunit [Haliea sp. SAOS-164]TGD74744.1 efflux RND transporter periplasmic adaptor subunit [Haliea sp. SAOS-164]